MSLVAEDAAGTRDAELDHSCFVPDDGGGWTLNGPLPRSNGWRTSPPFPTPGHSARATSQRPTGGTTRHCLTARGFASGSRTVCVADLQTQDSPYQNPAASRRAIANLTCQFEQQAGRSDSRIVTVANLLRYRILRVYQPFRHTKLCEETDRLSTGDW